MNQFVCFCECVIGSHWWLIFYLRVEIRWMKTIDSKMKMNCTLTSFMCACTQHSTCSVRKNGKREEICHDSRKKSSTKKRCDVCGVCRARKIESQFKSECNWINCLAWGNRFYIITSDAVCSFQCTVPRARSFLSSSFQSWHNWMQSYQAHWSHFSHALARFLMRTAQQQQIKRNVGHCFMHHSER